MFKSIRAQILAVTVSCLVITLFINTFIIDRIARRDNQVSLTETLENTSASHGTSITQWVNSKMRMIRSLENSVLMENPIPGFRQIVNAGDFDNVYVGYANGKVLFSDDEGIEDGYDPTTRPWYQHVMRSGTSIVTEPYIDAGNGKLIVTFAIPVKQHGQLIAVIAGDMVMDNVIANVRSIHPTANSSGMLVNQDGLIIAAANPEFTLKPFANAVSGVRFDTLLAEKRQQTGQLEGRSHIFLATPVSGTQWSLVIALDENDATISLRSMLKSSFLTMITLVLLASLFLHRLVSASLRRLSAIRDAMDAISSGDNDLSQRLPEKGQDEVSQIARAFNAFSNKLAIVMRNLQDTSASVKLAAAEIATGNQDLSERTEQSAANLKETARAIEQITTSVVQSTDAAAQANRQATQASETATCGGEVVSQVIKTMNNIEAASAKIGDIISVIDAIAFQTNILALNAAVEAARAGEQGRGFAIVAGEVRNLASRSAEAAKEVKSLVESTTGSVADGSKLVRLAGDNMQHIVTSIGDASAIIREITLSTKEQMQGIKEINQAVMQIDKMVQQNAELVVESAAASNALQDQACELATNAGVFHL